MRGTYCTLFLCPCVFVCLCMCSRVFVLVALRRHGGVSQEQVNMGGVKHFTPPRPALGGDHSHLQVHLVGDNISPNTQAYMWEEKPDDQKRKRNWEQTTIETTQRNLAICFHCFTFASCFLQGRLLRWGVEKVK